MAEGALVQRIHAQPSVISGEPQFHLEYNWLNYEGINTLSIVTDSNFMYYIL